MILPHRDWGRLSWSAHLKFFYLFIHLLMQQIFMKDLLYASKLLGWQCRRAPEGRDPHPLGAYTPVATKDSWQQAKSQGTGRDHSSSNV